MADYPLGEASSLLFTNSVRGGILFIVFIEVFALFTNPPLAGAVSLSFQYWRTGNVTVGSFLLVIHSMTLYSIRNMI